MSLADTCRQEFSLWKNQIGIQIDISRLSLILSGGDRKRDLALNDASPSWPLSRRWTDEPPPKSSPSTNLLPRRLFSTNLLPSRLLSTDFIPRHLSAIRRWKGMCSSSLWFACIWFMFSIYFGRGLHVFRLWFACFAIDLGISYHICVKGYVWLIVLKIL